MKQTLFSARARLWKLLTLAGWLLPGSVLAQLITDEVPRARTIPTLDQVRGEMEKSRFRLGPIRLIPTVTVADAGYNSNVFGTFERDNVKEVSDWSATVAAGTRWVVPVGSKIYLRGEALPAYTWYQELAERRSLGGVYRTSVLGFFNRMSVEAGGYTEKSFAYLRSEFETQVIQNIGQGSAKLELDLSRRLSLFADAEIQSLRFTLGGADPPGFINPARFDRTEGAARSGIRYRISPRWNISAAVEGTRTGFVRFSRLDNEGLAYVGGVHYSRPRFFVNVSGGYRTGRPDNNSRFPKYSTTTGSYFASYFFTRNVELQLHGGRRLVYAQSLEIPYFFQERNGALLNVQVLPRLLLRGYGEYGASVSPFATRTDTTISAGGGFSVFLFGKTVFTALADRSTYTSSNVPGLTRSVLRITTGLTFEGELSR